MNIDNKKATDGLFQERKRLPIFLFTINPLIFLLEIPVIVLLAMAIGFNESSENVFKLYPLIIFLSLLFLFIIIYFLRGIIISNEEIKSVGLFSSRDSALINRDKTLIIAHTNKKGLRIYLFGDDGLSPQFDWLKDKDGKGQEIYLYRGKAIGNLKSASKILDFFDVPKDISEALIHSENYLCELESYTLSRETRNDFNEIKIKFKKTL